ncbi:MAG: MFS transporter [Xanthomonadales bacterium]|nr:MFS transporter [Xanthomonadales bacterium]
MTHTKGLLRQKRFGPFFGTQALGAFNDNVFKNALAMLITFQGVAVLGMGPTELVPFAGGVFILPFFLFSALAGQFADKYEKSALIRRVKLFEIGVMSLAAIGFWLQSPLVLMLVLFLMGTQSAFFGPLKYGIIPQILEKHELVQGNGFVSMATFVAILIGTLFGGWLMDGSSSGLAMVSVAVILVAVLGYGVSRGIPAVAVADPELKLNWNIFTQTVKTMGYVRENPVVFRSILGASWFWFFGATILGLIPNYTRISLQGSNEVATLLLALFSVGVGVGSLACHWLSARSVEIGLVPLGALGLTLFGADLYFATQALQPTTELVGAAGFLDRDGSFRIMLDVVLMGAFGGVYFVPLNALIQHRSRPDRRSRVLAGGNVLNALLMVISALYTIVLLKVGVSIPEILLLTAVLNAVVATYIFLLVPEFLLRFAAWVLVNTIYRVEVSDLHRIPEEGPALLVCNHVSFVDALVIGGSVSRPVRFVMYYKIFDWPVLRWIFRTAKAIPIASARENQQMMDQAFDAIKRELEAGELVCIFPEGAISRDGEVQVFRRGVEKILAGSPVPVVPMALSGLWGSFFSRSDGGAFRGPMRRFLGRIHLAVGDPVDPGQVTADGLRDRVLELMDSSAPTDLTGAAGG